MGKPYTSELEKLDETFTWAVNQNCTSQVNVLKSNLNLPLISVGSGGSFSAAEAHSSMHKYFFRRIASAVTPVELISSIPEDKKASVWFISASGNNIDIKRAFQHASVLEVKCVSAMVGKSNSTLKKLSDKYRYTNIFENELPCGKDGFLATNSLLAFVVLLYKSYCLASDNPLVLPNSIDQLLQTSIANFKSLDELEGSIDHVLTQKVIHVVYSPEFKSTAIDIESKFIEAGLGSVHLADMRNFAHGRHHWFSKNEDDSSILFLSSETDKLLATKTMNLLPENIPKFHLTFKLNNGLEIIAGLIISIYLAKWKGDFRNIDPGRPGVPSYGSKIYRLSAKSGFISSLPRESAAVSRKLKYFPTVTQETKTKWGRLYRSFSSNISKKRFGGIVLDYDGTVVDNRFRGSPPSLEICGELNRLLSNGLKIAFATGRGKSIRKELRQANAINSEFWDQVEIGYYNGSEIGLLSNDEIPNATIIENPEFKKVKKILVQSDVLMDLQIDISVRNNQMTVQTDKAVPENYLWECIQILLSDHAALNVQIRRSSHSVDIISPGVTKLDVFENINSQIESGLSILTIGDKGQWPGNDFQLLSTDFSLSVEEVSYDQNSCWNLCDAGKIGPQGAYGYLKRMKCTNGIMIFG